MSTPAVVIFSGGMDSFTLLHETLRSPLFGPVTAFTVDYGQRHRREIRAAEAVCAQLHVPHRIVDASFLRSILSGSALTDDIDVPEGHYEDASMTLTVVPNRNMILIALAAGFAMSLHPTTMSAVIYGAHTGDHAVYPDCRREFVAAMTRPLLYANYHPVELHAPYLNLTKTQILKRGLDIGLHYGDTWTCYKGGEPACGKCGSCTERLEAFEHNGVPDPLQYEA